MGTPKDDETVPTFIKRKANEAFAAKNWEDLYTFLSVYSTLTGGGCTRTQGMQDGVAAYLSAQQLEAAGQFGNAVEAYSKCVAQLGKLVPRQEAQEALQRLRRDHPDAFGTRTGGQTPAPEKSE